MLRVKTRLGDDVRRFAIGAPASLAKLRESLAESYQQLPPHFSIKYIDDDQDEVTIATEDEFLEAVRFFSSQNQPLHVFLKAKPVREAASQTTAELQQDALDEKQAALDEKQAGEPSVPQVKISLQSHATGAQSTCLLPKGFALADLVNAAQSLSPAPQPTLKYADDEGDLVTIASDEDLEEALLLSASLGDHLHVIVQ